MKGLGSKHSSKPSLAEWLQWMQDIYIPKIISTGCFEKHQFVQLMKIDETEGPTFATQYFAQTLGDYNRYLQY